MQLSKIKHELQETLRIASPLVVAAVATIVLEMVDTMMLGWLGKKQIAGGALVNAGYLFLVATTAGLFTSLGVSIANTMGENNPSRVGCFSEASLWIAIFLSLPVMMAMWWCADLFAWVGQPSEILGYTKIYSRYYTASLPAVFLFFVCREILAGLSRPTLIMWVSLIAIPVNVLGNYVLMYGKWGFPAMGVGGIALSTSLVTWCMFLSLFFYIKFYYYFRDFKLFQRCPRIVLSDITALLRLGGPAAFSFGFESSLFSITAVLMGYFGTVALASHQIAIQCATVSFMVPYGISQAAAIRVGKAYGAKQLHDVYWATGAGLFCGLCFATISSSSFVFFPEIFINMFLDLNNPENLSVAEVGASFLAIAGLFQLVDCIQILFAGSLRGLKDTFIPMWICIFSYSLCGLALGVYLGFYCGFEGRGLWVGLASGLGFCALFMGTRYWWLMKKKLSAVTQV